MKNIKNVTTVSLMIMYSLLAQGQSINPEADTIELDGSSRPCISVILDPGGKPLKKAWVKFLRKEYDFKLKGVGCFSNKDLLTAEKVLVRKVSSKQMNFYTYVKTGEENTEMSVFISFGYDIYVNEEEYPAEFQVMNEILESFLRSYLPDYYLKETKKASKNVKSLKREINQLKNDIADSNEAIEKHVTKIEEFNADVDGKKEKLSSAETKLQLAEERMKNINKELESL